MAKIFPLSLIPIFTDSDSNFFTEHEHCELPPNQPPIHSEGDNYNSDL